MPVLMSAASLPVVPKHLAIIMDGNGRWARARFLPRVAGHKVGVDRARDMVQACAAHGIESLTLFAFSSENWQRPDDEVGYLMELFFTALEKEVPALHKNKVRMSFIGERARFSDKLKQRMQEAEAFLAGNTGLRLNIAISYGGRWDIAQAANTALARKQALGDSSALTEADIDGAIAMHDQAPVDLLIRTGGEFRISNFVLWQAAYAELYFSPVLWPDFKAEALADALHFFAQRERRFGLTGEQVRAQEVQGEAG